MSPVMGRVGIVSSATNGCRPSVAGVARATQFRPCLCTRHVAPLQMKDRPRHWMNEKNCGQSKPRILCAAQVTEEAENFGANFPEDFVLADAVALAGCSFDAYKDPKGKSALKTTTAFGTVSTFVNRDFLGKNSGLLEVLLKSASGLTDADWWTKNDTYAKLEVGNSSAESELIQDEENPEWNETFHLCVRDINKDMLRLRFLDDDLVGASDDLGYVMYSLKPLADGKLHELERDVVGGGTVKLSLRYELFGDEDDASANPNEGTDSADSQSSRVSQDWRDLTKMAEKSVTDRFDPVCFVENKKTDTQAWVHKSKDSNAKQIVVAFRGTERFYWKDWITDFNVQPSAMDLERTDAQKWFTWRLFKEGTQVHKGFLDAYDSVKASVFSVVDAMAGDSSEWKIYVTGHSLGGALATLCAYELAKRRRTKAEVLMYNYGSPRVGNKVFADALKAEVATSWRIVNGGDFVTTCPRSRSYRHVERNILLNREGELIFDAASDSFLERLAEEANSFMHLLDGSAMKDHMSEMYLQGFRACIFSMDET